MKKDILVRTYIVYIGLVVFSLCILGKVAYIQLAKGNYWRAYSDSMLIRSENIAAERGSIYSEAGEVLSTSVPEFDIYIDFQADGMVENNGKLYHKYADSLAMGLSGLFKDKTAEKYKAILDKGFASRERFVLLKRKISLAQYEAFKTLPLIRLGRNKSGFISVVRMKRIYPYKMLANRTIGIAREANNVGLERQYNKYLGGINGKRLVRTIAGGTSIPIEGSEQEPQDGYDIVTNLDAGIQEIAHEALQRMMVSNEATRGTCIVMEVETGKIRAIANLGRSADGNYIEDYNYAMAASEPGSTWKLATLMSAVDDGLVSLESTLDLEGGRWQVAGQTVFDSEVHGMRMATVQQAFEKSSNVGMAKIAQYYYGANPAAFLRRLSDWKLDTLTGIDLPGEAKPTIYKPGSRQWSKTTLPWMGFGYNLTITPMHTAMLYNAVANDGVMMRPYLVNAILKDGSVIESIEPRIVNEAIAGKATIQAMKRCLEGVVIKGTGVSLKTKAYDFAGKTGTSLVADKGISYADKVYQSSFAGYFPANNPIYTIVVVIRNKPHASKFYGASVAGPVFREVADRLFVTRSFNQPPRYQKDSTRYQLIAASQTMKTIMRFWKWQASDSSADAALTILASSDNAHKVLAPATQAKETEMPSLIGVGLRDALALCERKGLAVRISGKGKVTAQSISPGNEIEPGKIIQLQLN